MKDGTRIVGARRRLRVILHSKDGQLPVAKPLNGPVIEIDVSDFQFASALYGAIITFHREPVILGSDQHPSRFDFLDGMISAAVAVRHLRGRPAECETEELVAEADTENRDSSHGKRANDSRSVGHRVRVT